MEKRREKEGRGGKKFVPDPEMEKMATLLHGAVIWKM